MADTKTETPADALDAAVHALTTDSPVHAPGRARIVHGVPADEDGFHVLIAICEDHDDPDNPPQREDAYGCCGSCVFVRTYDRDLAKQLVALLNAREPLASSLEAAAGLIDDHPDLARPHVDGEPCEDHACHIVHSALAVARALNGSGSGPGRPPPSPLAGVEGDPLPA